MGIRRTESGSRYGIGAAVAIVLAVLGMACLPGTAQAFTLIELFLIAQGLQGLQCHLPTVQEWATCIANSTCGNGFSVGVASGGPFAALSVEKPNVLYVYTYGDESTNSRATIRIKGKDLDKLPGWRAHAMETKQTLDVKFDGPWHLTRASDPTGKYPGALRFEFNQLGLRCVVPVFKE